MFDPWGYPPVVIALVILVFSYTAYGAVYRLYFSPIAKFPGPKFAALTFWNEFYYDVVLGGRYTWVIPDYHKRFGQYSYPFTYVHLGLMLSRPHCTN